MNKMMKKIMAILAVFAMVVTMLPAVGAKAAATDSGTITITKEKKGDKAVEGTEYSFYKIASLDVNNAGYKSWKLESAFSSLGLTANNFGDLDTKALQEKINDAKEIIAARNGDDDKENDLKATKTAEIAKGEQRALAELPIGYYLVLETKTPVGYVPGQAFFVAMPTTKADGSGWDYSLQIQPKTADIPDIEKTVDDANVAVDDEAKFTLTGLAIPTYDLVNYKKDLVYTVTDTFPAGLNYKDGSVKVFTLDSEVEVAAENYEVTPNGKVLTIKLKDAWIRKNTGKQLKITYTATVDTNIVVTPDGNTNTAKVEYTNNPSGSLTSSEDTEKVYTYGIKLTKQGEGENLDGVEFKLEKKDGENYVAVTGLKGMADDGTLTTDTDEKGNKGTLNIEGLDADVEYRLTETKTADGYTLLKNPIVINLTGSEGTLTAPTATCGGEDITMGIDANAGYATITVTNNKGFTLPETGGMGTYLFTIGGIVIMAGAAFALFAMKKKSK